MIYLLEPVRPSGFVSGGYRYQDEIMRRLTARGAGRQIAIRADELDSALATLRGDGARMVVDGLFAACSGRPLPAGITALLHTVPTATPWSEEPLPVIATSQPTADRLRSTARCVAVVRPGLDDCFSPAPRPPQNATTRILCIGTVCPAKGQKLVAEAVQGQSSDACEVVLLGDTSTEPDYVAAVCAAAGDIRITRAGCLPPAGVAAELRRADLLVSASRDESFGMAVAEAVACGVPVLAFDTGEIATAVEDGRNGWLIPSRADDAMFARQLVSLLDQPDQLAAARRAAPGRRPADWDQVSEQFARLEDPANWPT